jgi:hypothetical protein
MPTPSPTRGRRSAPLSPDRTPRPPRPERTRSSRHDNRSAAASRPSPPNYPPQEQQTRGKINSTPRERPRLRQVTFSKTRSLLPRPAHGSLKPPPPPLNPSWAP